MTLIITIIEIIIIIKTIIVIVVIIIMIIIINALKMCKLWHHNHFTEGNRDIMLWD